MAAPSRASACFQILVGDVRQGGGNRGCRGGVDRGGCLALVAPQRRLPQRDPRNGPPAEEAVDPFADHLGECWISIAAGPSTRSTSVPGSRSLALGRARATAS